MGADRDPGAGNRPRRRGPRRTHRHARIRRCRATSASLWLVPDARPVPPLLLKNFTRGIELVEAESFDEARPLLAAPALAKTPVADYARYYTALIDLRRGEAVRAREAFHAIVATQPGRRPRRVGAGRRGDGRRAGQRFPGRCRPLRDAVEEQARGARHRAARTRPHPGGERESRACAAGLSRPLLRVPDERRRGRRPDADDRPRRRRRPRTTRASWRAPSSSSRLAATPTPRPRSRRCRRAAATIASWSPCASPSATTISAAIGRRSRRCSRSCRAPSARPKRASSTSPRRARSAITPATSPPPRPSRRSSRPAPGRKRR